MLKGHNKPRCIIAVIALAGLFLALGFQPASAAPAQGGSQVSASSLKIDALYGSVKFAVNGLQNAKNVNRTIAAKLIIAEAKFLLATKNTPAPTTTSNVQFAALVQPNASGSIVGGLDLDAYCQSIGFANSFTPDPGNEVAGAAFTWVCQSPTRSSLPIFMQAACNEQYQGQVTIASPQDPNNAYSWVCISPTGGTSTSPSTQTTTYGITTPTGAATLSVSPSSSYLTVTTGTTAATDIVNQDGSGYMAFNGSNGGSVLTYEGSGGGSSV